MQLRKCVSVFLLAHTGGEQGVEMMTVSPLWDSKARGTVGPRYMVGWKELHLYT